MSDMTIRLGLTKVDVVDGVPIYSSSAMKYQFLKMLNTQAHIKRAMPTIKKLVDTNVIIPAFSPKNSNDRLAKDSFANKTRDDLLGLYSIHKNKIFILNDTNSKIFWSSAFSIGNVTFHEMMHYVARNKPIQFFKTFRTPLIQFYKAFFKHATDIEVDGEAVWKMIAFIFKNFEYNVPTGSTFDKLEHFYMQNLFDANDERHKEAVARILIPLNIFQLTPNKFFSTLSSNKHIRNVVISLLKAYKDVFGIIKPETTPIQELLYPSEVIAVSTARPSAQHYMVMK